MADIITVKLGDRGYPVLIGEDLTREMQAKIAEMARLGRRAAVITDSNVAASLDAPIKAVFGDAPRRVVPAGEGSKSLAELGHALDFLAAQRLDRSSALFVVGGGVIGDLGGFAAASYLRGIDCYQVPTTLLAMVDSSVGGKTGINLKAGKNLAGAFHQPRGVFIATGLLATLPAREFAAGAAEVIKFGLLGDAALFDQLERVPVSPGNPELTGIIRRCCAGKARIVEADERELAKEGGRALLNLGHTFGHAIEQATAYGEYLHGEAVAIGLGAAGRLSHKLGLLSAEDAGRIETVVAAHGLPTRLRSPLPLSKLLTAMGRDKKVQAGGQRFVVLSGIGTAVVRSGIDPALVEASFREVGAV
jgi:3-dehydroquinate synthase